MIGLLAVTAPLLASEGMRVTVVAAHPVMTTPAFFGAGPARLTLRFEGIGTCEDLVGRLYQVASALAAPLAEPKKLDCGGSHSSDLDGGVTIVLDFEMPDVDQETEFEWRFASCPAERQEDCEPVGEVAFAALPRDLLEPLAIWSQDNVLQIHDPSERLQSFFDSHDVAYVAPGGPVLPGMQVLTLVAEDEQVDDNVLAELAASGPLVVFRNERASLPLVVHKSRPALVDVSLPILDRLAQDPGAVVALLEILRLVLSEPLTAQ